jgi:hypothetical protein
MKNKLLIPCVILTFTILFISCGKQSSQKETEVVSANEPIKGLWTDSLKIKNESFKKSLWTESAKRKIFKDFSKTDYDKYVLTELISYYDSIKSPDELREYILSEGYQNYRQMINNSYKVTIEDLAGKSKKVIEKLLGEPNNKDKVSPSGTPCPCDKYNYIYDLIEIVFINGKADWITVNNKPENVIVKKPERYQSINQFSDYTYVKVFTR